MLGKKRTGFTMIEMLVVVVILGLLATLVVPKVVGQGEEAKRLRPVALGNDYAA